VVLRASDRQVLALETVEWARTIAAALRSGIAGSVILAVVPLMGTHASGARD